MGSLSEGIMFNHSRLLFEERTAKERKLARIANRRTAYELVITDGVTTYLVAYSQAKTRRVLWDCITHPNRVNRITHLAGIGVVDFGKRVADGATMGSWSIKFSGRTQREAYIEGELAYIGDLEPATV